MVDRRKFGSETPEEIGNSKPGERSGAGTQTLWHHLAQDAQRKSLSGRLGDARLRPERSSFSILVVDDKAAGRYAMCRGLQAAGYDTLVAAGGAEALQLANEASAVVLDVDLPDVHGLEVCRLLRSNPSTATLPIIHFSAVYVEEHDRDAGRSMGADHYILAPVSPDYLADLLDTLIATAAATSRAKSS